MLEHHPHGPRCTFSEPLVDLVVMVPSSQALEPPEGPQLFTPLFGLAQRQRPTDEVRCNRRNPAQPDNGRSARRLQRIALRHQGPLHHRLRGGRCAKDRPCCHPNHPVTNDNLARRRRSPRGIVGWVRRDAGPDRSASSASLDRRQARRSSSRNRSARRMARATRVLVGLT